MTKLTTAWLRSEARRAVGTFNQHLRICSGCSGDRLCFIGQALNHAAGDLAAAALQAEVDDERT